MQAVVMVGHGGPDALEVRDDVAVPEPGPGDVLVEVAAAGVNMTDIWTRMGSYGRPDDPDAVAGWRGEAIDVPRIQGGDVAGRVVDVGPGTDRDLLGARVLVDPAHYQGRELVGVMGSEFDGGFAEYVAVAAEHCHDVGDSPLSDEQLACLPIAYGTAMGMLERAGLADGETVLVTGASGGVGMAAIDLASARDARVIALTSSGHEEVVRRMGANEIVFRDEGELPNGSVDLVVEVVGGPGLGERLELLRPEGRMVVCGAVAGPVVQLDLRRLYLQRRRLIGSTMHTGEQFRRLVETARRGDLHPTVAGSRPLSEVHLAQDDLLRGEFTGKIVLVPGR